ncbi:Exonuclease mut-7 [Trichinella pseudospiralis]|uniref:Uncharacterized protein n=1 Tax=Trichinella pseudospiralis TaxID=6337 RepID=A0A0V0Y2Q7_TRIPS|nr:hypothetical protein T4E_3334 [Trichinella pseudospiralis]
MTVAIDMAAAFKRAKQLRRVKLSAHSVNNAALERVDQQSLWKRATFGALLCLSSLEKQSCLAQEKMAFFHSTGSMSSTSAGSFPKANLVRYCGQYGMGLLFYGSEE